VIDTNNIFKISSDAEFEQMAMQVFAFQFENNPVYRSFCDLLYKHPSDVKHIQDIPFLPIEFFKSHKILSNTESIQKTFSSSGTTGSSTSKHHITDLSIYEKSFKGSFRHFYGDINDYVILALLPSYLEREGSSLVHMTNELIRLSGHEESGFYLDNLNALKDILIRLDLEGTQVLLIGVSFALLDLIETHEFNLNNTIVMETGGMKGRRKELIREELHYTLMNGFGVTHIHSEYGMTELLSQAYSKGDGIFQGPPWMRILIRDTEDALTIESNNQTGGINVIDLANINSCAFIATQDLGKIHQDATFEVLGRFDHSDIRGCNLMAL
jgi:phenylacetate-coenzyme A ligase PaaK-like adenylate-forming protein